MDFSTETAPTSTTETKPKMIRRTLQSILNETEPLGFDYEIAMFLYLKCNGRDTEAQEYWDTYMEDAERKRNAMSAPVVVKPSVEELDGSESKEM